MKKNSEIKSNKWKIIIISTLTLPMILLLLILFLDTSVMKSSETEITVDEIEDVVTAGDEKELKLLDYDDVKDYTYKSEDKQDYKDNSLIYKPNQSTENDLTSEGDINAIEDSEKSIDSQAEASDDKKNNDTQIRTSSNKDPKKVVIDESSDTMKDETKQNEYKGEESPKDIEFFEVKPSGKSPNGDVNASGEHIGNWN